MVYQVLMASPEPQVIGVRLVTQENGAWLVPQESKDLTERPDVLVPTDLKDSVPFHLQSHTPSPVTHVESPVTVSINSSSFHQPAGMVWSKPLES